MPFVDHNEPWILDTIKKESKRTKELLRNLRHAVEQGQLEVPPRLVSELGLHAGLLARAIQQYTIRHDILTASNGPVHHSEYASVMQFVAEEVRNNPALIHAPAVHLTGPDDYTIYRDELGFSEQEYKDLVAWKKAWDVSQFDPVGAFDVFSTEVIGELQASRYSISAADIVPGVAGIVGIAADVGFFGAAAALPVLAPSAVPALVASCTGGLAAIASKFSEVRKKLLGRGRG